MLSFHFSSFLHKLCILCSPQGELKSTLCHEGSSLVSYCFEMNKWKSLYHWNRPNFFPPRKQEYKLKEAEFGPKTYGVRSQFLTAKFSFQLSVDEARWHIGKLIFVQ